MESDRLTEKKYWDKIYSNQKENQVQLAGAGLEKSWRVWLKNITRDYSSFLLWDFIYPNFLPIGKGQKMLEIGCAPAGQLISFYRRWQYDVFGVEYSEDGVLVSQRNFKTAGLPVDHIIKTDFFDLQFQNSFLEYFDLVLSRGFIEHFSEPKKVIADQLKLLKTDGFLITIIPNLRGLNYFFLNFFNVDSLKGHNFSIMDRSIFRSIFQENNVEILFCDYIGSFSFGLFNTNRRWKYWCWRFCLLLQRPIDFIWRITFGFHYPICRWTSPYLICIGKKK